LAHSFFGELKRRNVFKVAAAYVIVSWLILQVVGSIVPIIDAPEWISKTILVFLIAGFPIALVFAWAFELTPEGIKKESEVDRSESKTQQTSQKINFVIIAALVFIIGGMAYERTGISTKLDDSKQTKPSPIITQTSIAVLPFADMSPLKDQEYFSDGISEEILNVLAKIPDLQITSRSSSFSFKGTNTDIPTIAKKLGVTNILEGSVRKSGTKVRITAQLIDTRTDKHLWSETYDRDITDIFKVQDEISAAIVKALRETLGIKIDKPSTTREVINPKAYDLYLLGLQQFKQNSFDSLSRSIDLFEAALKIEPAFNNAKTSKAISLLNQFLMGSKVDAIIIKQASHLLNEVLVIEPDSSQAYLALSIAAFIQKDYKKQSEMIAKAYQYDPNNADTIMRYARIWSDRLSSQEVSSLFSRARKIDPMNAQLPYYMARYYRRYFETKDLAEKYYKLAYELNPINGNYLFGLAELYGYSYGDLVKAVEQFKKGIRIDSGDPDNMIHLARSYFSLGDAETALAYAEKAIQISPHSGDALMSKIVALVALNDTQSALSLIELTANDPDVFHREKRYSKRYLEHFGVYLYLQDNNFAAAKTLIEKVSPGTSELTYAPLPTTINEVGEVNAIELLATIYRAEGDTESADKLAARLAFIENKPVEAVLNFIKVFDDLKRSRVSAAMQKNLQAIDYITSAIDSGYILNWRSELIYNPVYSDLQQEPRFKALIQRLETEMTRQLKIVQAADI